MPKKSALDEFLGVERQSEAVGDESEFNLRNVVERGRFEEDEDDSLEEGSEEIEETEIENGVEDEDTDVEEDGEEAEEDDDSDEEDPGEEEEDDSESADDESSEELEEAKAEIANLEKRVKDNRTAYLKEHELRLKLEKQLDAERKKPKSDDDLWLDGDDDKEDTSDSKEDPETEKLRREVEELKTARENDEKQRRVKEFEAQEAKMRTDHSDYDEMREFLEAVYPSNKAIQDKFMSMGATAEAVYELGREVQAELDPDGYKEYLKKKLKKKKAEKNKQKKKELNSLGSTSVSPKREVSLTRKKVSAVESIFGKK